MGEFARARDQLARFKSRSHSGHAQRVHNIRYISTVLTLLGGTGLRYKHVRIGLIKIKVRR